MSVPRFFALSFSHRELSFFERKIFPLWSSAALVFTRAYNKKDESKHPRKFFFGKRLSIHSKKPRERFQRSLPPPYVPYTIACQKLSCDSTAFPKIIFTYYLPNTKVTPCLSLSLCLCHRVRVNSHHKKYHNIPLSSSLSS